ncbi:hypothetical protein ES703_12999 [subsurface metagenome]
MKISTVSAKASAVMLITFCLAGSLTVGCSAHFMYMYSIEELTHRADVILVGKVESITHCWADFESNISFAHRKVQVSVEHYLKNTLNLTEVTIVVLGASLGNSSVYIYTSPPQPEFNISERVLLFLVKRPSSFYRTLGLGQGKFTIKDDIAVNEFGQVIENVRGFTETDINYRRMVEEADFIVVGNVTRIHGTTYVYVTIAVEEYVTKPQNYSEMTLSVRDAVVGFGRVGENVSVISNSDLFEVGERVFVFVERRGPRLWVLDGEAGKYTVIEEWPPYVRSFHGIIDGWSTAPGWKPRMVHLSVGGRSTSIEVSSAYPASQSWGPFVVPVTMCLLLVLLYWRRVIPR